MEDGKYQYTEWSRCTALSWLVLVISVVLLPIGFLTNVWLFGVGLLGVSFVFPLVFSFGKYSRILLSHDLLVVGNDTVPLADLDAEFGAKPQEQALSPGQREQLDEITFGRNQTAEAALLGGAFARPLGTKLVVIRRRSGELGAIATLHGKELVGALNGVLRARGGS